MKLKLFVKYLLLYMPAILGMILFYNGVVNLISSLLLFLGGYVALKNTFDYRMIKRNVESIKKINNNSYDNIVDSVSNSYVYVKPEEKVVIKPKKVDDIVGLKSLRIHNKVRKRY